MSAKDLSSSILSWRIVAAWSRWTTTSGRPVPTPINIPFGKVIRFFEKSATRIRSGMQCSASRVLEAGRTILFGIEFGCGAPYMIPALLFVTDTDVSAFGGIVIHFPTLNSGVLPHYPVCLQYWSQPPS